MQLTQAQGGIFNYTAIIETYKKINQAVQVNTKPIIAAVAASIVNDGTQSLITAVNSSSYTVLSISSIPAKKESITITKRPDGLYQINVISTNLTLNIATVCPEVN